MSQAGNCDCPCPDPVVTEIPGSPGADGAAGAAGTNGINAFTVTTSDITLPAAAGPVILPSSVGVSSWMVVGQEIFIGDGTNSAHFRVLTLPSAVGVTLDWLDYAGDSPGLTVIASGAGVSPSGTQPLLAAPLPNALTDNTTGTASDTLAAGVGVQTLAFAIQLDAMTTAAADLVTNYTPGYAFKILAISAAITTIGAGAGASQVLNMEIGTTNLTGGVVTLTEANTNTLGALIAGTNVTANNTGTAADTISIEVANGGTVFSAGAAVLLITIQNMDSASAFASLADHVNDLILALT